MKEPCSVPLPAPLLDLWHFREATRRARASRRQWPLPIAFPVLSQEVAATPHALASSDAKPTSLLILPANSTDLEPVHCSAAPAGSGLKLEHPADKAAQTPAVGVLSTSRGDWPRGTPLWALRSYELWCRATFTSLPLPKPLSVEEEEKMLDDTARLNPAMMDAARAWLRQALHQLNDNNERPLNVCATDGKGVSSEAQLPPGTTKDKISSDTAAGDALPTSVDVTAITDAATSTDAGNAVASGVLSRPAPPFTLNALEVAALRRQPQFIERFFDTFPPPVSDEATATVPTTEGGADNAADNDNQPEDGLLDGPPGGRRREREAEEGEQQPLIPLDPIEVERRARHFRVLTVVYPDIGDS